MRIEFGNSGEAGVGDDIIIGHDDGPLVLSVFGSTGSVRVESAAGPLVMPFQDDSKARIGRRMFQIVPAGHADVETIDDHEWSSTWSYFVEYERHDEGRPVERRSALVELIRYMDEPCSWHIAIDCNGVRVATELPNYEENPIAHETLKPPYAKRKPNDAT